jgi:HEAT repeat protein
MPLVYARLGQTSSERDRQRLTVLRYRLAARTSLVLRWPNGLERLVEGKVDERHAAAMELTQHVSADDEALLLELFSDPDPFVRELCLRALRQVGGSSANMALLRLLDDPSPDVKAAVLGQLAESPLPQIVPRLSAYIESESDPDLVVHAVRALRAIGTEAALEILLTLFEHESWHVRAEAVDAVGEIMKSGDRLFAGQNLTRKAEIYGTVMHRLTDPDAFVVSRAVGALEEANLASVIDPLSKAALAHPELGHEVVQAIAHLHQQRPASAAAHLRAFARHDDPRLRAAALGGLLTTNDAQLEELIQQGLGDAERPVRIAAAKALFELIHRELPTGPQSAEDFNEPVPDVEMVDDDFDEPPTSLVGALFQALTAGGSGPKRRAATVAVPVAEEPADAELAVADAVRGPGPPGNDAQLEAYYHREDRPDWQTHALPALETMLGSQDPEERRAAAMCLVPFGEVDRAWPVLWETAGANSAGEISRILSWLVWDRRRELFDRMLQQPGVRQQMDHVGAQFVAVPDRRTRDYVWDLLAVAPASEFATWHSLMFALYGLSEHPSFDERKPSARLLDDWRSRANDGPIQRLMAASLLYPNDKESAAEIARSLADDAEAQPNLRADAWQIALLGQSAAEAQSRCISLFRDVDQPLQIRRLALSYLALGSRALSYLRYGRVWVDTQAWYSFGFAGVGDRTPGDWGDPPEGITPQDIRPFLAANEDPEAASHAAFLAVWLFGDRLAWQQLLSLWKQRQKIDPTLNRLVYRAAAELDDEAQAPVLAEIYESVKEDATEVKEFYWTIRALSGDAILQLRKRIRDEVGMEQLRN